jgi:hypothetical protein
MTTDSGKAKPPAATAQSPEDEVPELRKRLRYLNAEHGRCLKYANTLSGWSMFWKILLIAFGALIAAQGSFAKVWGNTNWITVSFIVLGVLTAAASGFDAAFKPGERSPKFAAIAFEYDDLQKEAFLDASSLYRDADLGTPDGRRTFNIKMDELLKRLDAKLKTVRDKELALYVTGPTKMGRRA